MYLADADGSNAVQIQTGQPFNFGPTWSPDGQWVLFVCGEHYNCHPHVVRSDGTGLKKLADRGGYRGVIEFLDVPDFHGGSSDTPVWSADGNSVYYTAQVGTAVELFHITLDGKPEQLTISAQGTRHYHPQPSPDGKWLLYGSKRNGIRQLFVMRLADRVEHRLTNLKAGEAAMWPCWQPVDHHADRHRPGPAAVRPDSQLLMMDRAFRKDPVRGAAAAPRPPARRGHWGLGGGCRMQDNSRRHQVAANDQISRDAVI